jgi:hypothetical protein
MDIRQLGKKLGIPLCVLPAGASTNNSWNPQRCSLLNVMHWSELVEQAQSEQIMHSEMHSGKETTYFSASSKRSSS